MGTKYSTNETSGYNSSPPADDGTVSEANKVKWSTIKTKLTDPLDTLASTINSELVTHFNNGPTAVTTNTTLAATHYNQIIQASGSGVTLTLTDAATLAAGWYCDIVSTDTTNSITLARATASDMINESSNNVTILPLQHLRVVVNAAANGFLVSTQGRHSLEYNIGETVDFLGVVKTNNTALKDGAAIVGAAGGATVTQWAPRNHISGLLLSHAADTDHDITISAGECADSGNAYIMKLTSSTTKQLDATWAAGSAAGGLFSGTVANTTVYYIFLIRKDSDGSIDAGFDTSSSAANIPAGYTAYRMLGYVYTDGSANIAVCMGNAGRTGEWITSKYMATTSGTSILFPYVPPGTYEIEQNFYGVSTDGTSILISRFGDSGGIESTGYTSNWMIAGPPNIATGSNDTTGFLVSSTPSATSLMTGRAVYRLIDKAAFLWAQDMVGSNLNDSGYVFCTVGYKATSAELTQFNLTTVGGTAAFDAGGFGVKLKFSA